MIDALLQPLQSEFMLKAIGVSALIGLTCAALSCFVTLKGWSLMGDALSHAVVPGVAIAYAAKLPFALGAFASGMLAAGVMGFVKDRTRLREDAVIGIVFTTFFALGVLLISLYPSNINLKTIVFGNILGIADADIVQVLIISAVTLAVLAFKWKDLVIFLFDPSHARAVGLPTRFLHALLLTLLAATAVASLQAVGACLVVAMLVTPGATAYLLTDRFGAMMLIAMTVGTLTAAVGAYASYFLNGSTGGCIVVLQTGVFAVTLAVAPKHGLITAHRSRVVAGRAAPALSGGAA
ncbi:MAG: metal ABC transporter permease [Phycisphaerales bacterium]|nr:metal ABC transporter permease [Phycisphaerales bacterium]